MIVEVGLAALGVIGAADLGLTLYKKRPVVVKQDKFICPFCENEVHGIREIDVINHVTCIDSAKIRQAHEEALAAEETKRREIAAQERLVNQERKAKEQQAERLRQEEARRASAHIYNVSAREVSTTTSVVYGSGCRARWTVTRGGVIVDDGLARTIIHAHEIANQAVENHKQGKPPIGEKATTYTLS